MSAPDADPFVGRIIADRYEVGELISIGGMGRVHRGMQRSLERAVAIKFIHPHLLTSTGAVARFMTEARAASRLNHPNVVSVFDFGRTAESDGNDLYIVMELLAGSDLGKVLAREAFLPVERAVNIVRQTLFALGEAHHVGITHRDIKPENIVLERFRADTDHVKVIDFGIANVAGSQRITEAGMVVGTPVYMAPEQATGGSVGPSADLYSVAVILFELLTGNVPFDDPAAHKILHMHLGAERPDPRERAPDLQIPDLLAEACVRGMAIDPADRFADAVEFARVITDALPRRASRSRMPAQRRLPPGTPSQEVRRLASAETEPERDVAAVPGQAGPASSSRARDDAEPTREWLSARAEDLHWAEKLIEEGGSYQGIVFWGRPGIGRTTLMARVTAGARGRGMAVVDAPVAPAPRCEESYAGLRGLISGLTSRAMDPERAARESSDRPGAASGLRAVFGRESSASRVDANGSPDAAADALGWGFERAAPPAGGRLLVTIDDVDRMDGASLDALSEVLRRGLPPGVYVLMTSETSPDNAFGKRLAGRELAGSSRAEAERMAASTGSAHGLARADDDIEPMYIEQLRRWAQDSRGDAPPIGLAEFLDARVQLVSPPERRILQAIAVLGVSSIEQLPEILEEPGEVGPLLDSLIERGFVERLRASEVTVAHVLLRQAILRVTPAGTIAALHTRAAELLEKSQAPIEVRAYHAIRGNPDFGAFLLCEESARIRAARGDRSGVIRALSSAIRGARGQLARGDVEAATSAYAVFGRKLASALLDVGRVDEAHGVLLEALDLTASGDPDRALVLEQLAIVANKRGQHAEADRRWLESLRIAERIGDDKLLQRLRRPIPDARIGSAPSHVFRRSA